MDDLGALLSKLQADGRMQLPELERVVMDQA